MVRRFPFSVGAAGAAFLASQVVVCADGVSSIQFSDGQVLQIQGTVGAGSNTAYEVIQIQPNLDYAWQFNWDPGTNVDGWSMLQAIRAADPMLSVDSIFYGDPYDEHQVRTFTYNGITSSAFYSALFYGTYDPNDTVNPQRITWTGSGVGIDQLMLTSDPSSVPAGDVALANGSIIGWGTYSQYYTSQSPPTLPEWASIITGQTTTASADTDLGTPPAVLSFDGGTLKVLQSFNTPRQMTVNAGGGTIDIAGGAVFRIGGQNLLAWGGTLNLTDSGSLSIAQTGPLAVGTGATLNIAAGAKLIVNGSIDPFSDSFTQLNHVAIVNNGTMTLNISSTVAGITGSGSLTVGNGNSPAVLHLAAGGAASSVSSLSINPGSALDLTDNILNINYSSGTPAPAIRGYIADGQIFSSLSDSDHGLGYLDNGHTVEIRYTIVGDADLDGTVNFSDLLTLAANYGASSATWSMGDFNYDGTVNFSDLLTLAADYGSSLTGAQADELPATFAADWNLALSETSAVPEPATFTLAAIGIAMSLSRRSRRKPATSN